MQTCVAKKLKAAGKEVAAKMVCYEKAKRAVTTVDSTCLMRAHSKAENGYCPGDASLVIDRCVRAFLADDFGNGACAAGSARIVGTGAKRELACEAKDVARPGILPTRAPN